MNSRFSSPGVETPETPEPPTFWELERPWPTSAPDGGGSIDLGRTTPDMHVTHPYTEPPDDSMIYVAVGDGKVLYGGEFDLGQVGTELTLGLHDEGEGNRYPENV